MAVVGSDLLVCLDRNMDFIQLRSCCLYNYSTEEAVERGFRIETED